MVDQMNLKSGQRCGPILMKLNKPNTFGFEVRDESNVHMIVAAAQDIGAYYRIECNGQYTAGHATGGRELRMKLAPGKYQFTVTAIRKDCQTNVIVQQYPTVSTRIRNAFRRFLGR